ncbi:MAG TPA: hypothetical protein VNR38_13275 [Ureibacillus sp.]|nr:hypothetical protein [Ureibacillus sp.]
MKIYWLFVFLFHFVWVLLSFQFDEPSWWSVFTLDRTTHTSLMEHISYTKITCSILVFFGLANFLRPKLHKRN